MPSQGLWREGADDAAPAGFHETLSPLAGGGYRLLFKDGVEYRFRADGQLSAIEDPNGHVVSLTYEAGRLASVAYLTSGTNVVALTFEYDAAGLLAAVRDPASRSVTFSHENGDLATVTDVLKKVERYTYDAEVPDRE